MNWLDSAFRSCFRTREEGPIWEWAAKNVDMPSSPWPGKFSVERTPWVMHPLEAFRRKTCHTITVMAASAGSKSTIGELAIAWLICNDPGFTCWYSETEKQRDEFAKTRLLPLLKKCPRVVELMPSSRHEATIDGIIFPSMPFLILPANIGNAQSKHIRYLFRDEGWLWTPGLLAQTTKRTDSFAHNRKIVDMSTGGDKGCEFDLLWEEGTKREWQFKCPECGKLHVPSFTVPNGQPGGVRWSHDSKVQGEWDYKVVRETTHYQCPHCRTCFQPTEENGYKLNKEGCYTDAPESAHESYHWSAVVSHFRLLPNLAVEYLQAKKALKFGDITLLREFVIKREARSWEDKPENVVTVRADSYAMGDPWSAGEIRPMAVDVQSFGFWVLVRDWAPAPSTRMVFFGFVSSWADVRLCQQKHNVKDQFVFVDSRFDRAKVFAECCRYDWTAIQGEEAPRGFALTEDKNSATVPVLPGPRGVPVELPGEAVVEACEVLRVSRELTASSLNLFMTGTAPGWTVARDVPQIYRNQMASVVRRKNNSGKWEWLSLGRAGDHAWDLERYQIAAAYVSEILKIQTEQK